LEVAALTAICAACDITLDGLEVARLCQRVENEIVGAPCGIMDQVTVALGRENELLQLLCQPHQILPFVALPPDVEIFGINSHVKHSVGGGAYGRARCATFMGRRILRDMVPQVMSGANGELYLANLSTDVWRALRFHIPEKMLGRDFLARYESHNDTATTVEPEVEYSLRLATEHPIYEADRVRRFIALLRTVEQNDAARNELLGAAGDLMIQSHFSYDHRCSLGSAETDLLVSLLREQGATHGILGAKITGGGAGGTVAVMADRRRNNDLEATLQTVMNEYSQRTGYAPQLLSGSSPGAVQWPVRHISPSEFSSNP
jgi:L-arabinokinase